MRRLARVRAVLRQLIAGLFSHSGPTRRQTALALAASSAAFERDRVQFVKFEVRK